MGKGDEMRLFRIVKFYCKNEACLESGHLSFEVIVRDEDEQVYCPYCAEEVEEKCQP